MEQSMDPSPLKLSELPLELRLRILDFLPTSSLLNLAETSKDWNALILDPGQDLRVFHSRSHHPDGAGDISFLPDETTCFTHYYANFVDICCWNDLCRRQTLLGRSWSRDAPTVRTSLIAPRRSNFNEELENRLDPKRVPVWRFRPDFKRRFVLSTTQHGGLIVTDMDTGGTLWSLRRNEVRPYAHLEYSNGHMAFDRQGNAIEIWRHADGLGNGSRGQRGIFEKVADLTHDVETRGFQMLWPTLCVVSTEERGFVYDLSAVGGPKRTMEMEIASDTVGHLDQNEHDAVVYCIGKNGYDFHSKSTGKKLGSLQPREFSAKGTYHVSHRHGNSLRQSIMSMKEQFHEPFPPRKPIADHQPQAQPLREGPNLVRQENLARLEDDEWGAGLLRGEMMVAISKGGRCMICLDWPKALQSSAQASQVTFMIETEIDHTTYDFGGWLGVQRGPPGPTRIICEVDDKVYIMRLSNDFDTLVEGKVSLTDAMDVLSIPSSCATNIGVPISFMGVYDDCIMHTCLLGVNAPGEDPYIAKGIRIVTFAPTPAEMGMRGYCTQLGVNAYIAEKEEEDDVWEEIDLWRFPAQ